MSVAASVVIEPVAAPSDEVRALIAALDRELAAFYTPEQPHGLTLDAIFQAHVRFFLARLDGEAVGCGGVALFEGFAEVKRMYVREVARGRGVASLLLERIEMTAREAGRPLLRLETGVHQAAAIRFYTRVGFLPCSVFGDYVTMGQREIATSLFMEKKVREEGWR